MELCPPLHLGVVAIGKGAFGSPLTKDINYIKKEFIYKKYLFTLNPQPQARFDTRSIFKWSKASLNFEFSFS